MALLDIRNIPFEIALRLTDDEIIAIETSSTSYANYESIVAKNNANVEVASKSFSNISFADALKMTDAEIIALETGIFPNELPPPPPSFQKDPSLLLKDPIPDPIPCTNPTLLPIVDPQPQKGPSFPLKDPIPFPIRSSLTGRLRNPTSPPQRDRDPKPVSPPEVPDLSESDISQLDDQEFFAARLRRIGFIRVLESEDTRRIYKIVVDASVNMFNQQYNSRGETVLDYRWLEANKIVSSLVSKVTRCDMQGATVVFFS
eukprot:gene41248-55790_t